MKVALGRVHTQQKLFADRGGEREVAREGARESARTHEREKLISILSMCMRVRLCVHQHKYDTPISTLSEAKER